MAKLELKSFFINSKKRSRVISVFFHSENDSLQLFLVILYFVFTNPLDTPINIINTLRKKTVKQWKNRKSAKPIKTKEK